MFYIYLSFTYCITFVALGWWGLAPLLLIDTTIALYALKNKTRYSGIHLELNLTHFRKKIKQINIEQPHYWLTLIISIFALAIS